ncbi:MAG: Asp-tRNA(Asn)/Glu-tRNA(Gln) amidotransferase subunit GatC [Dethiobacteria bacterium]
MELPLKEINDAASDARIELTAEEAQVLKTEVQKVWRQLDTINNEAVSLVQGTHYAFKGQNTLRSDLFRPSLPQQVALQNAPDADETYFHVPRIVEQ